MSLLERIYFFHDELSRNRYPNSRVLMREFEISLPTARRDIAYLRDRLLAPLEYDSRKNGYYYSDDSFNLPFENSPRIVFLLGMLNRLAEEAGLSGIPEIKQLENKLAGMITNEREHFVDKIHCEWIEVEHPSPAIFDVLIEAMVKKHRLTIIYKSLKQEQTERTVEPFRLINYQGRWYLFAWCTMRNETRMFHLARIIEANLGGKSSLAENIYLAGMDSSFGIFKGNPSYHAEIFFSGEAAELVRNQYWHKDQKTTETGDGLILRLPVHDDREILTKILQYGSQAQVLGPPELVDKIKAETRLLSHLYK